MVIADRCAIYVNSSFNLNTFGWPIFVSMILYTIQLYAEFSGCINIVEGVSKMFGINLPNNFERPFFSKDIQEFWRRWHMTLGSWLKEYVFYPISLSKFNLTIQKFCKKHLNSYWNKFIAAALPLLFVWLVNGIWHGASYKYVIYGMYYYILMMIGLLTKKFTDKLLLKLKINKVLLYLFRVFRTILIVIVGMTLFRASSVNEFFAILGNIFTKGGSVLNYGLFKIDFIILIICNLVILLIGILEEKHIIDIKKGFTNNVILRSVIYAIIISTIVILGIYGEGYDASDFIYGAF